MIHGLIAEKNESDDWFVMVDEYPRAIDVAAICKMNGFGEAEARLFAAAPTMVDALKTAKTRLQFADKHIDCTDELAAIDAVLIAAGAA